MSEPTINIVKLAVGVQSVEELALIQRRFLNQPSAQTSKGFYHSTKLMPKKHEAIVESGSLYWVIKGVICARQKIVEIINTIAPEHLELFIKNDTKIREKINNAGSIFIGKFSPEAMGDYIAGPNHVLPTSGTAKFSSGLSVNDFLKRHSLIKISKTGIERLGPSVINLAQHENLEGHANSIKIRLKKER